MARFKIFWTVSAFIIIGFIATMIFGQVMPQNVQDGAGSNTQNGFVNIIENKFLQAYKNTIEKYGNGESNLDFLNP